MENGKLYSWSGSCLTKSNLILRLFICALSVLIFKISYVSAETVEYDLAIENKTVNFTGKNVNAMVINGGIPGPTLYFKEGDLARIRVRNRMNVETSIHWHGILVPPGMDGVPLISFPPIKPGSDFVYEFPIRQNGTYWYHSHTELQEQKGVYGSIVIKSKHDIVKTDRDYVVVLSDWTDEDTHEVLRTLKRGSEWYALQKGSSQSLFGASRLGMMGEYLKRELRRMPAMDIADVAYDYFLANGKPETALDAKPGESVRLRIINGSATTYFYLEFAGGPMKIVSADGMNVEPVNQNRFLTAVAETYDIIVRMPDQKGSFELRATAHDGSNHSSVWIGTGNKHFAPDVPVPNLYKGMGGLSVKSIFALSPSGTMGMSDTDVKSGKFDSPGMAGMGDMHDMGDMHGMKGMHNMDTMNNMDGMNSMKHPSGSQEMKSENMDMNNSMDSHHMTNDSHMHKEHNPSMSDSASIENNMKTDQKNISGGKKYGSDYRLMAADVSASAYLSVDGPGTSRPWAPYAVLRSVRSTALAKDKPVREIRLTLDGDMERYMWFINNKLLSEKDDILIQKGEIVRLIMINRTMMHHPMHLHGHFFRVINGQGDHSPLKHTVDVAPMSTTVIEFDANEFGDWFFHCHLLYHMKSGMARVVHYDGYNLNPQMASIRPDLYRDSYYFWGQADILSNMSEGFLLLSGGRNIFSTEWEAGWRDVEDTEWETIITWDRYINRFFTIFAGADILHEDDETDTEGVAGIRYLLPLNFESRTWIDTSGELRVNLEKDFQLTPRLSLMGEVQYDSRNLWETSAGFNYMLTKNIDIIAQWNSDYDWGGGFRIRF